MSRSPDSPVRLGSQSFGSCDGPRQLLRQAFPPGSIVFGIWAVFLLVVLVRSYVSPYHHSVYPIFSNAAREWRQGIDIYDVASARENLDCFRYAPIVAVLFTPFAAFPDAIGGILWRLVNSLVFLGGVVAFARSVFPGQDRLDQKTVIWLAWLLLPLTIGSLSNAQSNPLIVGFILFGVAFALQERWNLAALCLAIPVVFKVYPVSVVALVVLVQPRLGWRVAAFLAASFLLPFVLQEPRFVAQAYESWITQVSHDNRHTGALENSYRDFHILTRLVGLPMREQAYRFLQAAVALLLAGVVFRSRWLGWSKARRLRAAFDLGCCWIVLFGPATENCTYALLAPTMALAAWETFQGSQPAWRCWLMTAAVTLFVAAVVVISTPVGKSVSFYLLPLGGLLIFVDRLLSYGLPHPQRAWLSSNPQVV